MSLRLSNLLIPVAVIAAVGCSETGISDKQDPVDPLGGPPPCIQVEPGELQFADIEVGQSAATSGVDKGQLHSRRYSLDSNISLHLQPLIRKEDQSVP